MLKKSKLKNTNINPIVCVNKIKKLKIKLKIKFVLFGCLIVFIVNNSANAENKNKTE